MPSSSSVGSQPSSLLGLGRVGLGVPEEESELCRAGSSGGLPSAARRPASPTPASALASGRGSVGGTRPRSAGAHDRLGQLAQRHVAVAEDVALAVAAASAASRWPARDAVGVDDAEPAGRQRGQLAARASGLNRSPSSDDARRRARPVHARTGSRTRPRSRSPRCGEHELLGALLGALVRGALRVVGHARLVEAPAGLGVEDVDRARVHQRAGRRPRAPRAPRSRCRARSPARRSRRRRPTARAGRPR